MARLVVVGALAASAATLSVGSASATTGPTGGGGVMVGKWPLPQCEVNGRAYVASGQYSVWSCAFDYMQWGNTPIYDLWVA